MPETLTPVTPPVEQASAAPVITTPQKSPTPPAQAQPTATNSPSPSPSPLPSFTPTATPVQIERVVIISIDGLRPDAWEAANTPGLDALRLAGAYSATAQSVLPSVTLVNHASMLSGMVPEKHGIDWNFADATRGKIRGPTLFSVAREAGFSTAMVVGKPKLDHINLPGSVDTFIYAGYTDQQVTNEALKLIAADPPDVFFVHLPDTDSAGHLTGWMSPAQLSGLEHTDSLINDIATKLAAGGHLENALLIVTADHGGSGLRHGSESPEDMTVPWLAVGPGISAGSSLTSSITTVDTAATALYALGLPVPPEWDGRPVLEIFE